MHDLFFKKFKRIVLFIDNQHTNKHTTHVVKEGWLWVMCPRLRHVHKHRTVQSNEGTVHTRWVPALKHRWSVTYRNKRRSSETLFTWHDTDLWGTACRYLIPFYCWFQISFLHIHTEVWKFEVWSINLGLFLTKSIIWLQKPLNTVHEWFAWLFCHAVVPSLQSYK